MTQKDVDAITQPAREAVRKCHAAYRALPWWRRIWQEPPFPPLWLLERRWEAEDRMFARMVEDERLLMEHLER